MNHENHRLSLLPVTAFFIAGMVMTTANTSTVSAQACNWMTAGSYYTHSPATQERVHQFSPDPKVIHTPDPTVSTYRHQRSSLIVNGSMDQYHKVYRSGGVVRPYGEWQRPYRPYSVPYSDWAYGSPFGHLANPPRTNPILPPTLLTPGYYGSGPGFSGPGNPGPGYPGPGFGNPNNPGVPFPGPGFSPIRPQIP